MKIVLLVPYFGVLPRYFETFLHTCSYNQNVNWIIFCDSDITDIPDNVNVHKMEIEDFNNLSSRSLGIDINISKKYGFKICDLRPSFGVIFQDYIRGYDFWGHCDIDVLWGRMNRFLTEELLTKNDLITSRYRRISGHFCLYRNNDQMNNLYLSIRKYRQIFQSNKHYNFDEKYMTNYLRPQTYTGKIKRLFQHKNNNNIRIFWDSNLTTSGPHQKMLNQEENECLRWTKGVACNLYNQEMLYIHFHKLKHQIKYFDFNPNRQYENIIITNKEMRAF